jgi:Domain of unknown function (DUF4349)
MRNSDIWARTAIFMLVAVSGGCGQQAPSSSDFKSDLNIVKSESAAPADMTAVDASASVATRESLSPAPAPGEPTAPPSPTGAPATTTALLLAYSYSATLDLPANNVTKLMKAHEQKCVVAGAALCQVVTAASQKEGDVVSANLSIRATPVWLGTFRTGLEQDAKGADGKLEAQGLTSEDLTRSITDSEARLRALKSLRTRIEALIASRPGKLSDLLEAERELARVQGEIDSFESNLSVMRARVTMSTMDLRYQSRQIAVGGGTFKPLVDAVTGFFGVMAGSLAALITFLAAVLPFALIGVPVVYYGWRWRAKMKAKRAGAE